MRLLRRLAYWFHLRSQAKDLREELALHRQLIADEFRRRGLSPRDADAAAARVIGNETYMREEARGVWIAPRFDSVISDWRHAVRRLLRAPAFTLSATLTLALGIGGSAAVFTVFDGVLIRPLPYDRAGQLVDLSHTIMLSGLAHINQSDATYLLYRRDNRVFTDVGAYRESAVNLGGLSAGETGGRATERVSAAVASPSLFHVLGTPALEGRALVEADAQLGAPPVAVLSEPLWRSAFGADPAIAERRILIDGAERQIVGVMPATFQFPASETALWLPLQLDPARTKSAAFDYRAVARLRDGATLESAAADLQRLLPRVPEVFPGRLTGAAITVTHMRGIVRPLRDVMVGEVARVLWIMLGAVAALLLVACANVSNLFLARAEGRRREIAVRRALGAGRVSQLADFLLEAAIVSTAGAVLGLAGAVAGVRLLQALPQAASVPRLAGVHVDGLVVAVAVGLAAATAMTVAWLPLWRSGGMSLSLVLAAHGGAVAGSRGRHGPRRALVVSQVALALLLVAASGLFLRSFARLRAVNPGFDAEHALAFRIALPNVTYPNAHDADRVVSEALNRLHGLPGVEAAGAATKLPLSGDARQDSAVWVEDHPRSAGAPPNIHEMDYVSTGYFRAMGIPLLAGRLFARAGRTTSGAGPFLDPPVPPEVIVSEALAKRYWSDPAMALGRRVRMNAADPWSIIVGVAGDVRDDGLEQPPTEIVYSPLTVYGPLVNMSGARPVPWTPRDVAFVVRVAGDPAALATIVGPAMAAVAPTLPLFRMIPLRALRTNAVSRTTFTLLLLSIAAVGAVVVGAVGIYGVIAYLVSLRSREISVRLALGADPAAVRWAVVRQGMTDALVGVGLGVVGVLAATKALAAALFGVSPTDPVTLGLASALLMAIAIVASWLPARKAAALDPASALRAQ